MRRLLEYFIRRRNPAFVWNPNLSAGVLLSFAWQQVWNVIRGCGMLVYLRKPRMLLRGRHVVIKGLSRLHWGSYLKLGDHVFINAVGTAGIAIGNSVGIGAFSRLVVSGNIADPGKGIKIGNNVGIGEFAYLGGAGGLEIGDDCIAGQYLSCHPENHNYDDPARPIRLQGVNRKGIRIGANCWIGSKVTVLDGVTIGDNCIIAAGAVVNRSFPSNCVIGGVPARLIRYVHQKDTKVLPLNNAIEIADAI